MNYNNLQRLFINKIKDEESIVLSPSDVKFVIEPNCNRLKDSLTIKILVFNQEFGIGYARNRGKSELEYINDCYSRLHDYDTDSPKWHIWGLKVLDLEESYSYQLEEINKYAFSSEFPFTNKDITIDISDVPSEPDINGFRKYALYVVHNCKNILVKEIDIYDYDYDFGKKVINELKKKVEVI